MLSDCWETKLEAQAPYLVTTDTHGRQGSSLLLEGWEFWLTVSSTPREGARDHWATVEALTRHQATFEIPSCN